MTPPRIGVLAMQGAFREHIDALERIGAEAMPLRSAAELGALDGVVLPGGESTTMDKLLRKFELQQPLRERMQGGLPAMATCAGVILLADEVYDGLPDQESLHLLPLKVRRNAYGRQPESFEADLDIDFLDTPFTGVFIRSPVIEEADASLDTHAWVGDHPVMVSNGRVLAMTFHPELTHDDRIHRFFVEHMVAPSRRRDVAISGGDGAGNMREAAN